MTNLLFVQTGFGVDQHGDRTKDGATKAAIRAVRNAIEFNSIPGVIEAVPGGRTQMLIRVLLGVPRARPSSSDDGDSSSHNGHDSTNDGDAGYSKRNAIEPMRVDLTHVAKVFPYGRLLPIQIEVGGLAFPTGRIVHELGDQDDVAVCVAACVSIGYDNGEREDATTISTTTGAGSATTPPEGNSTHTTYDTRDGF
mmetsp:Transcript_29083/g.34582  ORF Transcript_29083/g.34582 Transcript_29083/m.34582 type:complete len:196 (-) Transcript_29083:93-680(-)